MSKENLESIDDSWDELASEPGGSESGAPANDDTVSKAAASNDASTPASDVVAQAPAPDVHESPAETESSPPPQASAESEAPAVSNDARPEASAAPAASNELFADLAPKRAKENEPADRPERLGEALDLVRATRSGRSIPPPPSKSRVPEPPPAAVVVAPARSTPPPPVRSAPPPPPSARALQAPALAAPEMDATDRSAAVSATEHAGPVSVPPAPPPSPTRSAPPPDARVVVSADDDEATPPPRSKPKSLPQLPALSAQRPHSPRPPPPSVPPKPLSPASLPATSLPPLPKLPPLSSFMVPAEPPTHRRMPSLAPVVTPVPLLARPRARLAAAAAMFVAVVVAIPVIIALLSHGSGSLLATVAGPGNVPVDALRLYVDGKLVCETSPCRVDELARGTHFVRVAADGYQRTADRAIVVVGGEESVLNFALSREPQEAEARVAQAKDDERTIEQPRTDEVANEERPARRSRSGAPRAAPPRVAAARPPAAGGKGTLTISASSPMNIVVDGRPLGQTPKSVRVNAGRHTVVFAGEEGRRVQVVDVAAGETKAVAARF